MRTSRSLSAARPLGRFVVSFIVGIEGDGGEEKAEANRYFTADRAAAARALQPDAPRRARLLPARRPMRCASRLPGLTRRPLTAGVAGKNGIMRVLRLAS